MALIKTTSARASRLPLFLLKVGKDHSIWLRNRWWRLIISFQSDCLTISTLYSLDTGQYVSELPWIPKIHRDEASDQSLGSCSHRYQELCVLSRHLLRHSLVTLRHRIWYRPIQEVSLDRVSRVHDSEWKKSSYILSHNRDILVSPKTNWDSVTAIFHAHNPHKKVPVGQRPQERQGSDAWRARLQGNNERSLRRSLVQNTVIRGLRLLWCAPRRSHLASPIFLQSSLSEDSCKFG